MYTENDIIPQNIIHHMNNLVFQLAIILFAARAGHILFKKLRLPPVLGELIAGVIIGPYLLGAISIPGFPNGLFHPGVESHFPISLEVFAFAIVASILHLFIVGLETDIHLFFRFSQAGLVIGVLGTLLSFFFGLAIGSLFWENDPFATRNLFLGVICSITSVGITTRVLSNRRRLDSPEGVTIIEGAVFDDLVGIILTTITLGVAVTASETTTGTGYNWLKAGAITLKAMIVGVMITVPCIIFARKIALFLKRFKNKEVFSVMAFAIALFIASIFEYAGIAAIVGAYVFGLALSKTDLNFVLKEKLSGLSNFLIPVFFTVMGMMIDLRLFLNHDILLFGLVYTLGSILTKFIGCGLPAYLLRFNSLGALRIGLGMIPRGEVVFVLAGTWLSYGLIDSDAFNIAMMMAFLTTVIFPPIFSHSLISRKSTYKKDIGKVKKIALNYKYPNEAITQIFISKIIEIFSGEGYFIHESNSGSHSYRISKEKSFISLYQFIDHLTFKLDDIDKHLVEVVVYEAYAQISEAFNKLDQIEKPESLVSKSSSGSTKSKNENELLNRLKKMIQPEHIIAKLNATTREGVIEELVELLDNHNRLTDKKKVLEDVNTRENLLATGLENGIALPHAKTSGTSMVSVAIGLNRDGIDFGASQDQKSKLIVLILASRDHNDAYMEVLSTIASFFVDPSRIEKCIGLSSAEEIYQFLTTGN